MTSVFAMLLVSEFIMPIYLKSGISTTPDFLGERYDASTKRWVSILFLISYLVNMLPSVLYSGAVAFNGLFNISGSLGWSYWKTICLLVAMTGGLGCLYSILGGIRAIAISDVVLGICMFVGGALLVYFGIRYLGHQHFYTVYIRYFPLKKNTSIPLARQRRCTLFYTFYRDDTDEPLLLGYGAIHSAAGAYFQKPGRYPKRSCSRKCW